MRCGWISGPAPILERIITYLDSSSQQPSGFSQSIIYKILDSWNDAQFHLYLQKIQFTYNQRRNSLLRAMYKYHLQKYAQIEIPKAGMFIWFTLNPKLNIDTLELFNDLLAVNVLFVPGCFFGNDKDKISHSFRCTFASASFDDFDEAIRRFVHLLSTLHPNIDV